MHVTDTPLGQSEQLELPIGTGKAGGAGALPGADRGAGEAVVLGVGQVLGLDVVQYGRVIDGDYIDGARDDVAVRLAVVDLEADRALVSSSTSFHSTSHVSLQRSWPSSAR